jgi:DNA-binding transcriptional regulator YhcF (GntR family)
MQGIFEIDASRRTPKYMQIVHSVTKAIKQGKYRKGDKIFSINELSNECFLSRDTVQKAYDLLEKERIIAAVRGKGFYINRTDIIVPYRILLVFNKISNYKKMIYDAFVKTMGNKATVNNTISCRHWNRVSIPWVNIKNWYMYIRTLHRIQPVL